VTVLPAGNGETAPRSAYTVGAEHHTAAAPGPAPIVEQRGRAGAVAFLASYRFCARLRWIARPAGNTPRPALDCVLVST